VHPVFQLLNSLELGATECGILY